MELFELLKKTISKMPRGWGETVKVDLTNGWTAPSDGILTLGADGRNDLIYVSDGKSGSYIALYTFGGGSATTSNIARKGTTYKIAHRGPNIIEVYAYFTPFSYRGGYLSRLVNFLQSLTFKGVMA